MFTETILLHLNDSDSDSEVLESGWSEYKGQGMTAARLAELLRKFGIQSRQVRLGNRSRKGYRRDDLYDAWQRYLGPPSASPLEGETRETWEAVADAGLADLRRKLAEQKATL
jgi:hypothetical protein